MKVAICLLAVVTITFGFPQQHEGYAFSNDAIKQAQSTYLIPRDAQIQSVKESVPLAAYESIPGNQYVDLSLILGDQVPSEVVNNLQGKINEIGRS